MSVRARDDLCVCVSEREREREKARDRERVLANTIVGLF